MAACLALKAALLELHGHGTRLQLPKDIRVIVVVWLFVVI